MQIKQVGPKSAADINKMNRLMRDGMTPAEAAKEVTDAVRRSDVTLQMILEHTGLTASEWMTLSKAKQEEIRLRATKEIVEHGGVQDAASQATIMTFLQNWKKSNPSGSRSEAAYALNEKFGLSRVEAEQAVTVVLDAAPALQWLKQNKPDGPTRQIAAALAKKFDLSESEATDIVNEWKMTGDASVTPAAVREAAIAAVKAGTSKKSFVAGYSGGAAETAAREWDIAQSVRSDYKRRLTSLNQD